MLISESTASVHFECLNNTNYAKWSLCMEAVLVQAGLWEIVQPTVDNFTADGKEKDALTIATEFKAMLKARKKNKMHEARAEIILCLEDGQLSHCLQSDDPQVIWQNLASVHWATRFATSLALHCKFLMLKKTSETMQAWIGQIQVLAFWLEQAGITVSDQDKILALTMGLPLSYDAIIINFDSTPTDKLTLVHVIS